MALPVLDAVFASSADLPRTQLLSKWLTEQLGSGSIADFSTLPERYLYAKIAVSLGGPRTEQEYIELPKSYAWSDIYGAIIFNRTAPAAPSSLTLTPLTSSSIRLNWVTNGASVAYSVERSVDGSAFQAIGTTAIGATTATNTGLSIASNYQYRIRGSSGGFFTGYSNTASASTYDANASSFIATSGATDIVAINDFVLGVKTLGLWNSMVCWPLRSSQNAGTGTTAYSLGGLGTFNGTLVGPPIWGVDGVTFATSSSVGRDRNITVPWSTVGGYDLRSNSTVFSISNISTEFSAEQFLLGSRATGNNGYASMNLNNTTIVRGPTRIGAVSYASLTSSALSANYRAWTTQRENNEVANSNVQGNKLWQDTTLIANGSNAAQGGNGAMTQLSEVLIIGNARGNTSFAPIGNIAFTAIFSDWTVNVSAIRTLYKDTLGQGLTGL